ncbi:FUSC family protein [Sphaerisporangium sp. TRM90804]|uniref:FUSC family protein n=1 Tax=Sphaerisporangium sp. TRM90804 TaxID=3031113 RepID=UPI0024479AED|nr:FUSC family protein [Sphaerisporangium sp. TRM90804]MDH2426282.1 FUSC family protein [Sphaerisporangium sp. TRM90804]
MPSPRPFRRPDGHRLADVAPGWLVETVRPAPGRPRRGAMARTAVAVTTPLIIGLATGLVAHAVLPAMGAMSSSLADRGGSYRARAIRMGAAALGGAAGYAAGHAARGLGWWTVPIVVAMAVLSALVSTAGAAGSLGGLQLLVMTVLGVGSPLPSSALPGALLYLAGALWAVLLVLAGWPLHPRAGEVAAVAKAYDSLGTLLEGPPGTDAGAFDTALKSGYDTVFGARSSSAGPDRERTRLIALLNQAFQIRNALLSLAQEAPPPPGAEARGSDRDGAHLDGAEVRGSARDGADPHGAGVRGSDRDGADPHGAGVRGSDPDGAELDGAEARRSDPDSARLDGAEVRGFDPDGARPHGAGARGSAPHGADPDGVTARPAEPAAAGAGEPASRPPPGLAGTVREVGATLAGGRPPPRPPVCDGGTPAMRALCSGVEGAVDLVSGGDIDAAQVPYERVGRAARLNAVWTRMLYGHLTRVYIVRLALCMGAAAVLSRVHTIERSYWIMLTVALVLKPDFGSVFARAVQRGLGTVAGALIGTVILSVVPYGPGILIPVAIFSALLPYGQQRNWGMMAMFQAPLVVLLVDLVSGAGPRLAEIRLVDTLVGCAIVLVLGYLPWPGSWQAPVGPRFADAVSATSRYLGRAFDPGDPRRALLHRQAYDALADLRTVFQRAVTEPAVISRRVTTWMPAMTALEQVADATAATAARTEHGAPSPSEEAVREVVTCLDDIADGIRSGRAPRVTLAPDCGESAGGDGAMAQVGRAVRSLRATLGDGSSR